ncbi:MAG: hypothetical protein CMH57_16165 [Myxococcales bacterium]|nr:hypothetical protein [Myxococcales bacterium]
MENSTLPPIPSVQKFLADLLCRNVDVEEGVSVEPTPRSPVAVATYTSPDGSVGAMCVFDLELANFAGASLSLIPVGLAKDSVRSREVPPSIEENLLEICNIGARLFDHPKHPSVRFQQAFLPQGELPEDVSVGLKSPERIDLKVDIKGYGAGRMSLLRPAS